MLFRGEQTVLMKVNYSNACAPRFRSAAQWSVVMKLRASFRRRQRTVRARSENLCNRNRFAYETGRGGERSRTQRADARGPKLFRDFGFSALEGRRHGRCSPSGVDLPHQIGPARRRTPAVFVAAPFIAVICAGSAEFHVRTQISLEWRDSQRRVA